MGPQINNYFKLSTQVSLVLLLSMGYGSFAQHRDTTLFFRSTMSVTQNGFSFIPSFSLGKPAVILEPSIGNKRLSFEPQLRFSLEGKPWSFIFIYRYKLRPDKKFQLQIGGHIPALIFTTQSVIRNGATENVIVTNRFLAAELIPDYAISKNVRLGMYLLRGRGFDKGGVRNSYFAGIRSQFSNVEILKGVNVRLIPQVYYLRTDNNDGFYATNTLSITYKTFPFSVSSIVNQAIDSTVPGKDFDWNVSLVYSFDKKFVRQTSAL